MRFRGSKAEEKRAKIISQRFLSADILSKDLLDTVLNVSDFDLGMINIAESEPQSTEFLRDGEYLYALLGNRAPRRRQLDECERLILRLGGLLGVFDASLWQLEVACAELGLSFTPAFVRKRLDSVMTMEHRLWMARIRTSPADQNFQNVVRYVVKDFALRHQEEFHLVYLDQNDIVTGSEVIPMKKAYCVVSETKEIMSCVLRANTESFIVAHNHIDADINPSEADSRLTKQIEIAASLFGVTLFDHFIVSGSDWFSFRVAGLLESRPNGPALPGN